MGFDALLIGSGLSALGAALALLERGDRVLCLTGGGAAELRTYPETNVPVEFTGPGGLGNYWHGVIPLSLRSGFPELDRTAFTSLLERFYPAGAAAWIGEDRLLVPFRPIRPFKQLKRLAAHDERLVLREGLAINIEHNGEGAFVHVDDEVIRVPKLILAAGALGTPRLLQQSGLIETRERPVSDHLIGYAGRVRRSNVASQSKRPILRQRQAMALPCDFNSKRTTLYTLRPARFDLAALDAGIEKRAIFGLPTSRILAGLAGRLSPGLICEAFFNRFGVWRNATWQSVNFMTEAHAVYRLAPDGALTMPSPDKVSEIVRRAVADCPFAGLEQTRRPELFIPGIHLHGTLDPEECRRYDPRGSQPVKVVDASRLSAIGSEHHSFKMMAMAYQALRATG